MQGRNLDLPNKINNPGNRLRTVVSALAIGALIISGLTVATVRAEDKPDQTPHDMHNMPGMEHMEGMDHSMHQHMMSERGTYTSRVISYTTPELKLVDSNGKSVPLHELINDHSAVLLNFIFTTCTTICPVMSATFQQVQENLGADRKDVRLVSISIDPENDTPAKLKVYAEKFKVGPQWTLLTGSLENSIAVQKAFGAFAGEKMNHKPVTFLKAKGSDTQWVRLDGLAEADQIIKEYDKLSSGNIKKD